MKKFLILLLALLLLVTGCGEKKEASSNDDDSKAKETEKTSGTLTCTKSEKDEDGYLVNDTMEVTYKDKKVTRVKETNISEVDKDYLDMSVSFGEMLAEQLNKVDGVNVVYSKEGEDKLKFIMDIDFKTLDVEALQKQFSDSEDESTESTNDSFYSNKDANIDDFVKKNLADYTCK